MVLFGGWDGKALLWDIWEWHGKQWTLVAEKGPSARVPVAMAYDEARAETLLFGGKDLKNYFKDTWTWQKGKWHLQK